MRRTLISAVVLLSSISLFACSFVNDNPNPSDDDGASGPYDKTGLALTSDALGNTDIHKMKFTVQEVDCTNGSTVGPAQTQTTDYEDMYLPGGIPAFEGKPYDKDSQHIFADSYFVVDAGCYNVTTQPLRAGGSPSQDCHSAHKDQVRVKDGRTTEILLVNQCKGPKRGGLDVAGTINHEPEIKNLTFTDSKFVTSCRPRTEVCVTATDPDDDPLTFKWTSAKAPKKGSIKPKGTPSKDPQTGLWTACAEVATSQKGEYNFRVRVFDMDGNGNRIEKVLRQQHPQDAHQSRDTLRFPMYGMTQCTGRTATILMAMNNNPGPAPAGYATPLIRQTGEWASPLFDASNGDILVVLDDNNQGEHPNEDTFLTTQLNGTFNSVNLINEPSGGLSMSDVSGNDVVWFVNPGYPMDDTQTFDTLQTFLQNGNGVVLQGDDMAGPPLTGGRDLSFFTRLNYQDNGTQTCGETTDNNSGNNYRVRFTNNSNPILDGLRGNQFQYGDDIDHTARQNAGEQILARARFSSGNCTERYPAIVAVDPVDIP